jgi:3-dehydroquinate synthase
MGAEVGIRYNTLVPDHHVNVTLKDHAYTVHVGSGLLVTAGQFIRQVAPARKALVLTDEHVARIALPALQASLVAAGYQVVVATVAAGEHGKTLEGLLPAFDAFLSTGIDRRTPVVALGGGIVGDMAGFLAASLLRGVPFVQVPTTLLAMVDASVGGKTGVNHRVGKNLIGAFHHPHVVLADVETLKTLPQRELRAGLAECIKHDVIRDAAGFAELETSIDHIIGLDAGRLSNLVAHNVRIKSAIVMADPMEHGERAYLNLGHTFGHAIETTTGYTFLHGEAVGLGLIAAARLAEKLELLDAPSRQRIEALVGRAGLPTVAPGLAVDRVIESMFHDKKVRNGTLRFVLPDGLGKATIRDDVPLPLVRETVASLSLC